MPATIVLLVMCKTLVKCSNMLFHPIPFFKKQCLNSNGHQFHQYQQNEQSPLNLTEHKDHDI
jgi:hypothetical protein